MKPTIPPPVRAVVQPEAAPPASDAAVAPASSSLTELEINFAKLYANAPQVAERMATESDATAQCALSSHKPTSRPHHRFGTVLERLFVVDRRRLEKIVDEYLGRWQLLSEAEKRSEITKEVLLKEKRSMGKALFDELCTQLQSLAFRETAYCEEHGKHCCISPKATAELADCFWIEIAGTTCTPWSVMGNQMGWLGRHTLPCLVFFFL